MKNPTAADLRQSIDQITQRYSAFFAGQPRISRDASILDALRKELQALQPAVVRLPGNQRTELGGRIKELQDLYGREAVAIREAQAQGPDALAAHRLASWAYLTFARYRHHFAGHSRGTRDLGLLSEMIADLQDLRIQMDELKARFENAELREARALLDDNLGLYLEERKQIAEARLDGELSDQADRLAALANAQFELYAQHFADQPRVSRRPMLLDRIIEQLLLIQDRMKALEAQGLHAETNRNNVQIVTQRVASYQAELTAINQARAQTDFKGLVNALGEAANAVFELYRQHFAGQDRKSRELPRMVKLLDALWDIGRQMDDLDQVRQDSANHKNLRVVLDYLRMYDREHKAIADAQQA